MKQAYLYFRLVICVAVLAAAVGCAKPAIPIAAAKTTLPQEQGVASWYGHPFDGRQTASGEIFDMEKLTAAHRTFAFGTVVRVENQGTGKTVDVRINDRGPFVAGRIIDLSHGAAQSIAMPATANVKLQVLSVPATRGVPNYAMQIGAFATQAGAVALQKQTQAQIG